MDSFIDVQPCTLPAPVVTKVQIRMPNFSLLATETDVSVMMYSANDQFVKGVLVHIPADIYSQWGTDDNFIVDYVLSELGLERLVTN